MQTSVFFNSDTTQLLQSQVLVIINKPLARSTSPICLTFIDTADNKMFGT